MGQEKVESCCAAEIRLRLCSFVIISQINHLPWNYLWIYFTALLLIGARGLLKGDGGSEECDR